MARSENGGLLMGVFDNNSTRAKTLASGKRRCALFYTDGLVEAHTPAPHRVEFAKPATGFPAQLATFARRPSLMRR